MGNSQPTNETGKKVVQQKLENATKTGILSLSEHHLETCPSQVFAIKHLKTLDLSKNLLQILDPRLGGLVQLKSLNLDHNKLSSGSLAPIVKLSKLQTLSVGSNQLGSSTTGEPSSSSSNNHQVRSAAGALPEKLPTTLKYIKLDHNGLFNIPPSILSPTALLIKLEKLDLSGNRLTLVPNEISNLSALTELNLDSNRLISLPSAIGTLKHLKVLSLKQNQISVQSSNHSQPQQDQQQQQQQQQQPLPESLFVDTPLIDLNLHGNPLTSTQLNAMQGYPVFLERRQKVKTSTLLGGGLTNMDVCGLE